MIERPSVRLSVCPVNRQQRRRPASLLLSALRARDIDSTAAGALQHEPALSSKRG